MVRNDLPYVAPPDLDHSVELLVRLVNSDRVCWQPARFAKTREQAIQLAKCYRSDANVSARAVGPDGPVDWRPAAVTLELARKLLASWSGATWRSANMTLPMIELLTLEAVIEVEHGTFEGVPGRLKRILEQEAHEHGTQRLDGIVRIAWNRRHDRADCA